MTNWVKAIALFYFLIIGASACTIISTIGFMQGNYAMGVAMLGPALTGVMGVIGIQLRLLSYLKKRTQ